LFLFWEYFRLLECLIVDTNHRLDEMARKPYALLPV
jgi:hypothetical protein